MCFYKSQSKIINDLYQLLSKPHFLIYYLQAFFKWIQKDKVLISSRWTDFVDSFPFEFGPILTLASMRKLYKSLP